jgi:hypothetical protein
MLRIGNANTGFIAHLTDDAEAIAAAGAAQKPNPPAAVAFAAFVLGNPAMREAPDHLWPLFAAVGLIGVAAAVRARRDAEPDQVLARAWFWAVLAGAYALLVAMEALGLD